MLQGMSLKDAFKLAETEQGWQKAVQVIEGGGKGKGSWEKKTHDSQAAIH